MKELSSQVGQMDGRVGNRYNAINDGLDGHTPKSDVVNFVYKRELV